MHEELLGVRAIDPLCPKSCRGTSLQRPLTLYYGVSLGSYHSFEQVCLQVINFLLSLDASRCILGHSFLVYSTLIAVAPRCPGFGGPMPCSRCFCRRCRTMMELSLRFLICGRVIASVGCLLKFDLLKNFRKCSWMYQCALLDTLSYFHQP